MEICERKICSSCAEAGARIIEQWYNDKRDQLPRMVTAYDGIIRMNTKDNRFHEDEFFCTKCIMSCAESISTDEPRKFYVAAMSAMCSAGSFDTFDEAEEYADLLGDALDFYTEECNMYLRGVGGESMMHIHSGDSSWSKNWNHCFGKIWVWSPLNLPDERCSHGFESVDDFDEEYTGYLAQNIEEYLADCESDNEEENDAEYDREELYILCGQHLQAHRCSKETSLRWQRLLILREKMRNLSK